MRVLFDSSVLVAALVAAHPMHPRAFPWLRRARQGEFEYLVATHSVLEVYAVLSRMPVVPRISPAMAARLVRENVLGAARLIALSATDYDAVVRSAAEFGLSGGVVYDALIARAARKARCDRLLTLNLHDFERAWPDAGGVLAVP